MGVGVYLPTVFVMGERGAKEDRRGRETAKGRDCECGCWLQMVERVFIFPERLYFS